ncbi:MAG: NusG domain II-containing protein [Oscillospiraceae bacterium]|nr:NusG domain II-containing protein [Oscillospiraceae bacterium]
MKKNKMFIIIIAVIFGTALICSLPIWGKPRGNAVNIRSGGELICTIDLSEAEDCEFDIKWGGGVNTIEIKDHMIHVKEADCPDGICIKTGWIGGENGTAPIVCLPNRLVIEPADDTSDGRTR